MASSDIINKFFDKFSNSIVKTIVSSLDKDSYKKIELAFESYDSITELDNKKTEDCILYDINYTKVGKELPFAVLVPEEFIVLISDLLMGGTGDKTYKGQLSELEVNAAIDLLKNIFKNVVVIYNKLCEKEIEFTQKPVFLTKTEKGYNEFFKDIPCDFFIVYNLKIDSDKSFKIYLLLDEKELKKTLSRLGGLFKQNEPVKKNLSLDSMNVDAVADLEIDIQAQLGKTQIPFKYALELAQGSMIELDTIENSDIKVFANGVEIAYAEIVAVGDQLGLRIKKLIPINERE